jgi:lysophosphatidate acyltransferase
MVQLFWWPITNPNWMHLVSFVLNGVIIHFNECHFAGLSFLYRVMPQFTTVTKKEMFYIIPFGIAAWIFGLIPIDRKSKKSATATLARCKRTLHDENAKILMFAEGTRNRNDGLLPFKTGAFRLAIEAQVPIIPMVFSPYYFIDRKANTVAPGHSIMQVLGPISTNGLTLADTNDLMERTRDVMLAEYGKLQVEVIQNLKNVDWKCAQRPIFTETTTCKQQSF